eukprot:1226927-Amphidinium_carterae.1
MNLHRQRGSNAMCHERRHEDWDTFHAVQKDGSFGIWEPGDEGRRVRGRAHYKGQEFKLSIA